MTCIKGNGWANKQLHVKGKQKKKKKINNSNLQKQKKETKNENEQPSELFFLMVFFFDTSLM